MNDKIHRRTFIKTAVLGAAAIPTLLAAAEGLPLLDPKDPTAMALGYVPDATKVDAKANPTHKAGQTCANCVQYQGKLTDKTAACPLFVGKAVLAGGWCKVWIQKPGV
ncbi:MAG: high-potential iron-sulfur protein [Pseudomonadota bacterium]